MDIDFLKWLKDWSMPLSAGATFLLAIAAFVAIWHNHFLQKRERKERLLNEVVDWASDIVKCALEQHFETSISEKRTRELLELVANYQSVDIKSHYIQEIARLFGKDFQNIVIRTDEILDEHIVLLRKIVEGQLNELDDARQWKLLVDNAIQVTKEAAKLKIGVI